MKKNCWLLATAMASLLIISVNAQDVLKENLSFTQYTDDNGLPQNSVKSIVGDAAGFVWMVTESGLVRFDGQNFLNFDRSVLPIPGNRFYLIHPDMEANSRKRMHTSFFATPDGANWVRISDGAATMDSLHNNRQINRMPYATKGYHLTMISPGLPFFTQDVKLKYYLIPTASGKGHFFACQDNAVEFYDHWKRTGMLRFATNDFWGFFSLGGKLYNHEKPGRFVALTPGGVQEQQLTGDILRDPAFTRTPERLELYWNSPADQAFLYIDKNLYRIVPGQDGTLKTFLVIEGFDLQSRNIKCAYYDQSRGMFYLGSMTQGMFVIRPKFFRTLQYSSSNEMDHVFYAHVPFDSNSVVTPLGIVLGLMPQNNRPIRKRLPFAPPERWDTRGIVRDRKGYFWVKSNKSLLLIDPKTGHTLRSWPMEQEIKAIYEDGSGTIWIGLRWKGLYRIRPEARLSAPEHFLDGQFNGISYITSRSETSLWVGTENGLYLVDLPTKKNTFLKATAPFMIKSIYARSPDEAWLTVADVGMFVILGNKMMRLPMDKSRYLASAHCIFEDNNAFFWITTNKGLFRFSRQDLLDFARKNVPEAQTEKYYEYYHKEDGFLTNEFDGGCQPCAVRVPNGFASLPSLKGLVWFRPEQLDEHNTVATSVHFDKIEHSEGSLFMTGDTLRLPTGPMRIKFSLSTPHYSNPYNLQLSYAMMENRSAPAEKDWVTINGAQPQITFSTLNSGNYVLYVRKIIGFGRKNYEVRKIHIIVPPLWYETWWARWLLGILIAAGVYLFNRYKLMQVTRENRRLELKVAKRTLDLDRTLKDLKTSNNQVNRQLHVLSRLLTSMTHDFQTPLNYINRTSSEIGRLMRTGQHGIVTEIGDVIANSSQNMSILMKDLLDYTKANVYGNSLTLEDINLSSLVHRKYEIFRNVIEQKENRFVNDIPDSLTVHSDRHMLAIIIHNLIDNATKFTRNGLIRVVGEESTDGICVTVTNNGLPVPPEIISLFNQDVQKPGNNNAIAGRNTGLGLLIVKEIASLIGARITVTQTDTTNFELRFNK